MTSLRRCWKHRTACVLKVLELTDPPSFKGGKGVLPPQKAYLCFNTVFWGSPTSCVLFGGRVPPSLCFIAVWGPPLLCFNTNVGFQNSNLAITRRPEGLRSSRFQLSAYFCTLFLVRWVPRLKSFNLIDFYEINNFGGGFLFFGGGFGWIFMDFNGFWQILRDFDGVWWIFTNFNGFWLILMDFNGF